MMGLRKNRGCSYYRPLEYPFHVLVVHMQGEDGVGKASHRISSLLSYPLQEPDGQIDIIPEMGSEVTGPHHVMQIELTIPNLETIPQGAGNSGNTPQEVGVLVGIPKTNPQLAGVWVFLQAVDDFGSLVIIPD